MKVMSAGQGVPHGLLGMVRKFDYASKKLVALQQEREDLKALLAAKDAEILAKADVMQKAEVEWEELAKAQCAKCQEQLQPVGVGAWISPPRMLVCGQVPHQCHHKTGQQSCALEWAPSPQDADQLGSGAQAVDHGLTRGACRKPRPQPYALGSRTRAPARF